MTPDNPRALSAEKLAEKVRKYNPEVGRLGSLRDAVHRAQTSAGEDDMILAIGSLSYLGELCGKWESYKGVKEDGRWEI